MGELELQRDNLKEEIFQLNRTLGLKRDKLEKDVVSFTKTLGTLQDGIDQGQLDLKKLYQKQDDTKEYIAKIKLQSEKDVQSGLDRLELRTKEFNQSVKRATEKLTSRESKIQDLENDIFYKENEFRRIARALERRETDIKDLIKADTDLVADLLVRNKEVEKRSEENVTETARLELVGTTLDNREQDIISREKVSLRRSKQAKKDNEKATNVLEINTKRSLELDIQGESLKIREKRVKKDRQDVDNKLVLLADRTAMYERNKQRGVVL